jgi:preprotein translocase subunit SecD
MPVTCAPRDDELIQCIAATLDRDRIVLVSSDSRDKYILGPVVIDGADVVRAVAVRSVGMAGWHVDFKLTPEATKRFAVATTAAVGKQLAAHHPWQVVSAPVVEEPILHGSVAITGGFDEEEAKALAAQAGLAALPSRRRLSSPPGATIGSLISPGTRLFHPHAGDRLPPSMRQCVRSR